MLFELDNVRYDYGDGSCGLANVCGRIEAGDRLAILGANGSGKSTLLRILNGLIEPTSGDVWFRGERLSESALQQASVQRSFRQRVGFVFQDADAQLFNGTVWDEIAFGPSQLGLDEAEVHLRTRDVLSFLGIEHLSEKPPFRLSGGEKRKVAIGSVLSMNPDVLLLDEPILGLDPRSQRWLIGTLNRLQEAGKTTVVATHSLATLTQIADKAWILGEDHSLLAKMSASEALRSSELLDCANLEVLP